MGLYRRDDSPYWWMVLTVAGQAPIRKSTQIHHDAPSAEQRAELKRQAAAVLAREQAQRVLQKKGIGPKPARTLREHLDWYTKHVTIHKSGADREREILARLKADLGDLQLVALTRERILEWRTSRRAKVSANTVEREMDVLKHALTEAVPTYLEASPIAELRRLKGEASEPTVLSHRDERKLLTALKPADRAIVLTALDTLVRAGDLLKLKWAQDHRRYFTILNPKSGKTYKVPISKRTRRALDRLPKTSEYIFAHRRKAKTARVRTNGLKGMLERACKRAKVDYGRGRGLTFHGLRHTGTSRMVAAGVDLRTVMALGGWASLRQLARYAHPTELAMRRAVETVGRRQAG